MKNKTCICGHDSDKHYDVGCRDCSLTGKGCKEFEPQSITKEEKAIKEVEKLLTKNHSPSEDLKKDRALKGVESYSSSGGDNSPQTNRKGAYRGSKDNLVINTTDKPEDTLSSKMFEWNGHEFFNPKDIKDFIKKLKEELNNRAKKMQKDTGIEMDTEDIIDKLAGKELT